MQAYTQVERKIWTDYGPILHVFGEGRRAVEPLRLYAADRGRKGAIGYVVVWERRHGVPTPERVCIDKQSIPTAINDWRAASVRRQCGSVPAWWKQRRRGLVVFAVCAGPVCKGQGRRTFPLSQWLGTSPTRCIKCHRARAKHPTGDA